MEDGCEIKKPKCGHPKKKENCNKVCRVCQTNLKIEHGNTKSCINLFKPSLKSDTFGVVWAGRLREVVGKAWARKQQKKLHNSSNLDVLICPITKLNF